MRLLYAMYKEQSGLSVYYCVSILIYSAVIRSMRSAIIKERSALAPAFWSISNHQFGSLKNKSSNDTASYPLSQ
ncbi:hypothetical protein [Sphingobacterium faecium]|uniref:hypothetical protein n=1 Tax=Sphingobacterium faecium TaxID=34087 RepID=UPI002469A018|nr:hypothetical protein [Sphingobacterium faecium]MDH5826140.1 hypothetical protein [Sphingobacterium faecium]